MIEQVINGKKRIKESTYITNLDELKEIINEPNNEKYLGKTFCARDKVNEIWIAIDNRTGDAYTEQFDCFIKMAKWFLEKEGILICQN